MAVYYVRKTGNDTTGDGSTGNPWLTIAKAKNTISTAGGHTVNIGAGTYAENDGSGYMVTNKTFTNEVIFQSESGAAADVLITSASGAYNIYQNGPFTNWRFKNVTLKGRSGATDCITLNQSQPFSGLVFEDVIFDGAGANSRGIGTASATPASAIQQTMTLIRPIFKSSGGKGGFGIRMGLNGSAPVGTNWRADVYYPRCDDASLDVCIESGPGCTLNVYGGRPWGVAGKGVLFAQDGLPSGKATYGSIHGAHIKSVTGHAFLVGGDGSGVKCFGNLVEDGDHATVIKAAQNTVYKHNISLAGTINALLVKGCDYSTIKYNILRSELSGGDHVFANYDGDPLYVCENNTILNNMIIMRGAASQAIRWEQPGDGGNNVLDFSAYRDRRTNQSATWGRVLEDTDIRSIAEIKAAFAAAGSTNEANASTSIPMFTYRHSTSGVKMYALLYNSKGDIYTVDGFVMPRLEELGFLPQCTIPLYEEVAGTGVYEFVWPTDIATGDYSVQLYTLTEWGFPSISDTYIASVAVRTPSASGLDDMLQLIYGAVA